MFVFVFVSAQRLVCWSYCLCSGSGDNGRIDSASSVIFQRATSLHVEKNFRVNLDSEIWIWNLWNKGGWWLGLNMPRMWSTGWLAFIYTLVRPYVLLLYNVDLYLALFSMRPRVLRSYMGVSRARLGFIYTVVRVSGPIGRHCVFSALWGVPQCAPSTENNQKQSNTKWTQIKPKLILNDFFSLCFSVNFNHPLSIISNENIWKAE